ncbi:MAG: wax ester/triacylglycerol synthase family O-acyltransferase [Proteobacteria bacterium]|nr:wax ester/triacylglycerol synthase family O-acyltransferase [Pseudomonadota bacterium]
MRRIDIADAGFLLMEKRQTPTHVGGINLFTLPKGVNEQKYLAELVTVLQSAEEYRKPFGEYVTTGRGGALGPMYWEEDMHLDIDYHVRHSALPKPGRYRELFALVSRLHSTLLDRNRPLWEVHLIEGLENRQFALYMKMHHAAIDGIGAMHLTQAMCSTSKSARITDSPLSLAAYERYKAAKFGNVNKRVIAKDKELRTVANVFKEQFDSSANLFGAFKSLGNAWLGRGGDLAVPWRHMPKTSINTEVSGARRFVAQSWDFARIKAVCAATDSTINDVVLAMCSGALRRYLISQSDLPRQSLKAMVPVSLRKEGDLDASNAVGFITADLATNLKNPEKRLQAIKNSMTAGKDMLRHLSAREAMIYMQIAQIPVLLTSALGLASKFPAFSTVISNVPGPREQLYWNGASLDGIYPASIVFDGFAMNITLVSYNNSLDFGIIACRRSLPQIQRLIDHLEESLQELEEVAGIHSIKSRRKVPAATAAKRKARTKAKSKPKAKVKLKAKRKTSARAKPKNASR